MADNLGQPDPTATTPSPAPVDVSPSTTPEATPPSDAGSSTPTQPIQPAPDAPEGVDFSRVDGDAYEALKAKLLSETPAESPGQPATPSATPEGTPTPETASPANETSQAEPPAPADAEGDDAKVPDRIRLGGLSEKDRALTASAVLLAKAEGISVPDAMARITGKPDPAAPHADVTPPTPAAPDIAAIRARIADLNAELVKAGDEADTTKMVKLFAEIEAGRDELSEAIQTAQHAELTARREKAQALQSSKERAHALYPALKDTASPLNAKWNEVYTRLQASNDPLLAGDNPNAPLVITQMAAAELGMPPVDPSKKAAPPTQPTPAPAARPVQPAPGSAKSTAPANATGQLAAKLDTVKTTDDYEDVKNAYLATRAA